MTVEPVENQFQGTVGRRNHSRVDWDYQPLLRPPIPGFAAIKIRNGTKPLNEYQSREGATSVCAYATRVAPFPPRFLSPVKKGYKSTLIFLFCQGSIFFVLFYCTRLLFWSSRLFFRFYIFIRNKSCNARLLSGGIVLMDKVILRTGINTFLRLIVNLLCLFNFSPLTPFNNILHKRTHSWQLCMISLLSDNILSSTLFGGFYNRHRWSE